jgi:hypothetical protein
MHSLSVVLVLSLPLTLFAQKPADSQRYQADAVVAFFLGDKVFQQYVKLDTKKTKNGAANSTFFKYNFRHPKFSGETFVIALTLDSAGQFVPGEETTGLVSIESPNDSTWIAAKQAVAICRDQARRINKRTLRLAWDSTSVSYDTFKITHDYRDIVPGRMVWKIDGEVLFRGDRYSGTFDVDLFTGRVARRFAIPWD